ncbi:MAG: hypothetical protein FWC95_01815 [Defluviitaleaceae bacterium]|nr:hypothetical protein [Defluviitaleaceae bacterium]
MDNVYLRFSAKKWLQEFRKGNIRFTCPLTYQDVENKAIGDELEGVASEVVTNCSPDTPTAIIKPLIQALRPNILSDNITITERLWYTNAHKDRILSLYTLSLKNGQLITPVSNENKMFDYDSFIVIYDVQKLFCRLRNFYSDTLRYTIHMNKVVYGDKWLDRNVFDKPKHQSYQNEFRVLVTDNHIADFNDGEYPSSFPTLGDISDITSDIYDINSLFTAKSLSDFKPIDE